MPGHAASRPGRNRRRILDLANWPAFTGFGPIPAIRAAQFEVRTPDVAGSGIRVTNSDGSTHVEQIVEWQPDHRLRLQMLDFPPPLPRLATRIDETCDFKKPEAATDVIRSFELQAKSALARPFLGLIAVFLKQAISRHLRDLGAQ
ncbi:MAG TPA: hypothetical protein VGP63_23935 [Planctomycetaceae bacterium]|nr:hypothetical protein [Planctomycetaceae bacterium]